MAKKPKPIKIDRSRRMFGNTERNRAIRRIAVWVLLLVFVFAAFFFLTKPVSQFIGNLIQNARNNASNSSSITSGGETSQTNSGDNIREEVPHAITIIDVSALQNTEMIIATARNLQDEGITEALIILKDENGIFHYASSVPTAEGAFAGVQVNTEEIVRVFTEYDISVSAGIYAYRDPIAANANRAMAVQYRGQEGVTWLDNYPENGGKPWLNPYSEDAQSYILQITQELADMGFNRVVVYAVQYPDVSNLGLTSYGPGEAQMTRDNALRQLITKLNALSADSGVNISIVYPLAAVREENIVSYIVNPLTLGQKSILIALPATNAGQAWAQEDIRALVDAAKAEGIEEIAVYFTGVPYTAAEYTVLKQVALAAGCEWVLFE